jgi:hypothetical protein
MNDTPVIAVRLQEMARNYNREVTLEVVGKALLGLLFSFFTFGFLFWLGWFVGFFFARSFGLKPWQFGALVSGLFLIVATFSAWQRVDPLAGVQPMTDREWLLTAISHASPHFLYFSPRHATAGAAVLLLGGPANLFQAFGIWGSRLRLDDPLIEEAACLLAACQENYPIEQVREPYAAVLLRRLALIKVVPQEDSVALTLTEKGYALLPQRKSRSGKRSAAPGAYKRKRREKSE